MILWPFDPLALTARSHARAKTWMKLKTSRYELYRGAGATLITSGLRSSTTTPASSRLSITESSRPGFNNTLICAPLSSGSRGVIMLKQRPIDFSCSLASESSMSSRYLVILRLFSLNCAMDVCLNTSKLARTAVVSAADGLLTWKPAAPGIGSKWFVIWNRDDLEEPHHPDNRGRNPCRDAVSGPAPFASVTWPCLSCTKQPPIEPGPQFMYL